MISLCSREGAVNQVHVFKVAVRRRNPLSSNLRSIPYDRRTTRGVAKCCARHRCDTAVHQ